ncbi:MAG: hypothetical protein ACR2PR_08040 [Pseudohongiellaceae bacterium]
MTEFASHGGGIGWEPADITIWNETQTDLAQYFNQVAQWNDGTYGVWNLSVAPAPFGDSGESQDKRRKVKHPAWLQMERRLEAELRSLLQPTVTGEPDQVQQEYQESVDQVQKDLDYLDMTLAQLLRARDDDRVTIMDLEQQLEDLEALRLLALEIQRRQTIILAAIAAAIFYYY